MGNRRARVVLVLLCVVTVGAIGSAMVGPLIQPRDEVVLSQPPQVEQATRSSARLERSVSERASSPRRRAKRKAVATAAVSMPCSADLPVENGCYISSRAVSDFEFQSFDDKDPLDPDPPRSVGGVLDGAICLCLLVRDAVMAGRAYKGQKIEEVVSCENSMPYTRRTTCYTSVALFDHVVPDAFFELLTVPAPTSGHCEETCKVAADRPFPVPTFY